MRLYLKQKVLSILDNYKVYDEQDNVVFVVKGRFSIAHKFEIYTAKGAFVGTVKQRLFTFLTEKFDFYDKNNNLVGTVTKKFTFFRPKYDLDFKKWTVEGDILSLNYVIKDENNNLIASINRKFFTIGDKYTLDIVNEDDAFNVVLITIGIDAAICTNSSGSD